MLVIFYSSLVSVWKLGKGKKRKAIEKGISSLHATRIGVGVVVVVVESSLMLCKYCSSAHAMYVVGMF